ncbi:MAG: biopolymer transporter ExbD [Pirellulaceae bacterium]|nr:MAG: biopolymer transporter ExbD [Pirellulaceae bacterium]GIW93384.1 MAG: biopolymer transporter ExbD [Pirellulaceae bacterium]
MRRTTLYSQQRGGIDVAMTPMIDVVFLLLVFFLWSTSFVRPEENLPGTVAVPAAPGGNTLQAPPPEWDFEHVVIRLRSESGRVVYQLNEQPMPSRAELDRHLAELAQVSRDPPVIIHPDGEVPLGAAIDIYDLVRQHGFTAAFATPQADHSMP